MRLENDSLRCPESRICRCDWYRVSDCEIDLAICKEHNGALLTIVKQVTHYTVTKPIFDKSATIITDATIKLLAPLKHFVLTITADNGKEFAYNKEVSKKLDCSYYFTDLYCFWQRGLNENTNGLFDNIGPIQQTLNQSVMTWLRLT
ncbi:MAG: IS30 family transposase [Psychromonas sp.]|nr:IS30 family transposase [Psychromonas sp.]